MENMNSLKIGKVDFIESELFYEEKKSKKTQNDDKTWKVVKILFFILVFIIFLEFIIYKYIKPCFSVPKTKKLQYFSPFLSKYLLHILQK